MPLHFIALLPPPLVQGAATQVQQHFARRYASRKSLNSPPHITLHPPFELVERSPTTPSQASLSPLIALEACLSQLARTHPAPLIELKGFGAFPPRVIYINVLKTPELLKLQANLAHHLEAGCGIIDPGAKNRPFCPHLTVAYRDLTQANFQIGWAEFQNQVFDYKFMVPALTLLVHNGQRWQISRNFGFQTGP